MGGETQGTRFSRYTASPLIETLKALGTASDVREKPPPVFLHGPVHADAPLLLRLHLLQTGTLSQNASIARVALHNSRGKDVYRWGLRAPLSFLTASEFLGESVLVDPNLRIPPMIVICGM